MTTRSATDGVVMATPVSKPETAFDCEVVEAREVATHGVLIGRVLATADSGSTEPLIHHRQRYATTRVLP